jgi:hypothetical protein
VLSRSFARGLQIGITAGLATSFSAAIPGGGSQFRQDFCPGTTRQIGVSNRHPLRRDKELRQEKEELGAAMPAFMVKAKSFKQFQDGAFQKFGTGSLGVTTPGEISATSLFKNGKLITVSFSMKETTSEWAEADFGGGPIHDYDLDAIQKCVQLSKDHEKKHKEAIEQTFRMWKPKAEKDLRDGTYTSKADAENAIDAKIDELKGKLQAACLDLHSKEGLIEVTFIKGQPKANVVMKPAGNTGCGPATPAMVRLARHGRRSPSVIVLGG